MLVTNSSGRRVSLLNDEPSAARPILLGFFTREEREQRDERHNLARSGSYVSQGSSPRTPDLLRSESYDSRMTFDPASPATPSLMEFGRQSSYANAYPDPTQYEQRPYGSYPEKVTPRSSNTAGRPAFSASSSYDDDQSPAERSVPGKRYPCRFKESHGCDKTFTTSGHASRHSKIHTAEKCVQCSFQGCNKKFTRADNMKQHLEMHYKERSRGSNSAQKSNPSNSPSKLTVPAGIQKPGAKISRLPSRNDRPSLEISALYSGDPASDEVGALLVSPTESCGALDLNGFRRALPTGLDALVDAVEFQSRN